MTSGLGATLTYDEANRTSSAAETSGGTEYCQYAPDNKRIYRRLASASEEWTLYGAYGEKLGVYSMVGPTTGSSSTYSFTPLRTSVWFTGMLIWEGAAAVYRDAVGTNRAGGARFYPYGDEITSTSNDWSKFATYNRDSFTGFDYADQRYYASTYGRFNTADPYGASGGPSDPGSWNRYSYVEGDPINHLDRQGLCTEDIDDDFWDGANETIPMEAVYYTPGSCMGDPTFQAVYSTVGAVLKGVFMMAPPPPAPPTPPPLTCDFIGSANTPARQSGVVTRFGTGSAFAPTIWLTFSAAGGTGSYSWDVTQGVISIGRVVTSMGVISANRTGNDPLVPSEISQNGATLVFSDSPGVWYPTVPVPPVPGALVTSFSVVKFFTTAATVTSGGQTADCPIVFWDAFVAWEGGKQTPTGFAQVGNVSQ